MEKHIYSQKLLIDIELAKNIGIKNAIVFAKIQNALHTSKIEINGVKTVLLTVNQIVNSLGRIYTDRTIITSLNYLVKNNYLTKNKKNNKIYYGLNSEIEKQIPNKKILNIITNRKNEKEKKLALEKYKRVQNILLEKRERNYQRQNFYFNKANKNQLFKNLYQKETTLNINYAKAITFNDENNSKILKQQLLETKKQINQVLASIGLTRQMIEVQYDCTKCNDTGWDAENKICECFYKIMVNLDKIKE